MNGTLGLRLVAEPAKGHGILLTGGSGRLGRELTRLLPGIYAPGSQELDITDRRATLEAIARAEPRVVLHAAAYTDVASAEHHRERCWLVNVTGTRNVARAAARLGARLVQVSTDYVFFGDQGGYAEDDTPGPVRNFYALSKLVAEEAARAAPHALVVRTSFRAREWPYEVAFDDLYTSQDYVDVIAPMLAELLLGLEAVSFDTVHVGTERKSAFDLAKRRAPGVRPVSKATASVPLPDDVSLDCSRYTTFIEERRRSGW